MTNPGHCYEETFNILINDDNLAKSGGKIVHGRLQDPTTKKWIEHAWIEFGTMVIDPTISDGMIRKSQYYEITNAVPENYYTDLEAIRNVYKLKKGICKWANSNRKPVKTHPPKRKPKKKCSCNN